MNNPEEWSKIEMRDILWDLIAVRVTLLFEICAVIQSVHSDSTYDAQGTSPAEKKVPSSDLFFRRCRDTD